MQYAIHHILTCIIIVILHITLTCMTTYILIATYNSQVWSFSVAIYLTTYGLLQLLIFYRLVFCAYIACLRLPYLGIQLPVVTLFCMLIYITYSPSSFLQSIMAAYYGYIASFQCCLVFFTELLYYAYLIFIITARLNVAQSVLPILSLPMLLSALLTSSQLYSSSGLHGYPVCYA